MATRFYDQYGATSLVAPREEIHTRLIYEARASIFLKCSTETEASQVINCCFEFLAARLKSLLEKIGSAEFLDFVLHQYDLAAIAWRSIPTDAKGNAAASASGLSSLRRGLKFLAESTVMAQSVPEWAPTASPQLFAYVEEALIAGELLAELYMLSDRVHYRIGERVEIDLSEKSAHYAGTNDPVLFRLVGAEAWNLTDEAFMRRLAREEMHRDKYFPNGPITKNFQEQAKLLDRSFEDSFDYPFSKFLWMIATINEDVQPAPGGYPVVFCPTETLVREVSVSKLAVPLKTARTILDGFALSPRRMRQEGRVIFNPKQENRALRRGYFEILRRGIPHLAWSRQLAREAFDLLLEGVCFQKLPQEWRTTQTDIALTTLSNESGKWFERVTGAALQTLGIRGKQCNRSIIGAGEKLIIPAGVGELDFLGYSQRDSMLVLVECKMLEVGFEARYHRDEISQFLDRKRGYVAKLLKKIEWIVSHRGRIANLFGAAAQEPRLGCALITLYPAYTAFKISDFPCVSLVEFMEDYTARGAWPYSFGIW